MPYGFYVLVRFVSMCVFAYLAIVSNKSKNTRLAYLFGALALLFQPFARIALGRLLWNVVDVAVAVLLIFLFVQFKKNTTDHERD